ncbi:hypothetical protein FA95DRAFT_1476637, partial [Auriscalpium vulgare]
WSRYLQKAEYYDKELAETWQGDADGVLIFTGLFSATVAAFILESYKGLKQDPSDTTNAILAQISAQLAAAANGTSALPTSSPTPFSPPASSVRVNALWLLSLCLSLTCALLATFAQQWARAYLHATRGR